MHAPAAVQPLLLAGLLLVLGSLVGWGMLAFAVLRERRYAGARRTTGRVVEIRRDPNSEYTQMGRVDAGRMIAHFPRIEFLDEGGRPQSFWSNVATTPPPRIGEELPIRHLPGRPDTARVATVASRALWFVVGGVLGPLMTAMGVVLVLLNR